MFLRFNYFVFLCLLRLVGGAGDIKLTKDGNTLLKEMVSFLPLGFLDLNFCECLQN